MRTNSSAANAASSAALQRLVWSRGHAATWRTIGVFNSQKSAETALISARPEENLRVLVEVSAAMRIGALTRDSLPEGPWR